MYLLENPVLQRELLVNLRMSRGFVLMLVYQAMLAAIVYFAWPQGERLDLSQRSEDARKLVDMFFLGQYVLASLMTPSFAAGAITGREGAEDLRDVAGQPAASGRDRAGQGHRLAGVPGGADLLVAAHRHAVLAAGRRVAVRGVCRLPRAHRVGDHVRRDRDCVQQLLPAHGRLAGRVLPGDSAAGHGGHSVLVSGQELGRVPPAVHRDRGAPAAAVAICLALFANTSARLLHPPDVAREGQEVVDLEQEAQNVVGLVIQRDQFPDKLFAPAKRDTLLEDDVNPVYDKEIRSEIFSQGTLMLRVVIQVSMLLAIPLMAWCLYIRPQYAPWYVAYVVVFNMLVGPVFSAGSVTSERERQTLDLLLTTAITPWQILSGKLRAGLRVSSVLTLFLLWPLLLACVMVSSYWENLRAGRRLHADRRAHLPEHRPARPCSVRSCSARRPPA